MTFEEISKRIMHGEKLYDLPLRVCYYVRVSTDSDVQLNSLDSQLNYYKNYIINNKNWKYVEGYIEKGASAVTINKRESFKKMIIDAKKNKFDLIITKEVSRFARDLEDSIHYIRILKNANVGIYFENQNLNTFDANSELILNIMFNLAQDESKKLSSRIKFGHRQAIAKGHVLGSSNITGYTKCNCKLVIDNSKVRFINTIFNLYSTGKYGLLSLSKKLASLGYKNANGNIYDKDTLKKIITNPKYKGFYRAGTYEVLDYRTKKRKKNEISNQIIYKCTDGSVPKIVSERLWDKANNILESRSKKYKSCNNYSGGLKYPFSSKICCDVHHTFFQRSKSKKSISWKCSNYMKFGLKGCKSPIILEKDLYHIFSKIFEKLYKDNNVFENVITLYNNLNSTREISDIEKKLNLIETKKDVILNLKAINEISEEELLSRFKKLNEEKFLLESKKNIFLNEMNFSQKSNLNNLKKVLNGDLKVNILNNVISKFLNKINVVKINDDRNNLCLNIYLDLDNQKEISYITNQKYISVNKKTKFNYSVFIL